MSQVLSKRSASSRPRGRAQVMAAVLAVAAELLAERGPRDVTVREVADRAGVNHALVHRHFGSKEELFRRAFAELSAQFQADALAAGATDAATMLSVLRDHPAFWRVLARGVLDAPELLGAGAGPAAPAMLTMISGGRRPTVETRAAVAVAGSLALGWLVFGPHLAAVLEINDVPGFDAAVAGAVAASVAQALPRARRGEP